MNKTVLITGATSGIGNACAQLFAEKGFHLIICGRRAERLQSLKLDLEKAFGNTVQTLQFDVQVKNSVFDALSNLNPANGHIDILINNAGLALGRDAFDKADMNDWETMIDTNLKGLLYVTRAALPYMKDFRSQIINIGSIAAKQVYENGNVYCATKHAVDAISKAMRIDLLSRGIKVTAIHPGAAETEFSLVRYKGDQKQAKQVYDGYTPLTGEDIADTVLYCATLPQHICINDLVITCTSQADSFYLRKILS